MNTTVRLSSSISKIGDFRAIRSLKIIRSNNCRINCAIRVFSCGGGVTTTINDKDTRIYRRSISVTPSLSLPKTTAILKHVLLKETNICSIFQSNYGVRRFQSGSSRCDSRLDNEKILVKDEGEESKNKNNNEREKDEAISEKSDTVTKRRKDHEGWNMKLQELILYKEKHGDCLVPQLPGPYHRLGEWVDRQRQQYRLLCEGRKSNMTKNRVEALERIGFVWNFYDQRWEAGYDALLQYKEKFGNCAVPNELEYEKLWNWVFKQKRLYSMRKRGESFIITDERIEKLNSIGFVWDLQEDLWTMRYEELLDYKANNGDTIVPRDYPPNKQLGTWCDVQRHQMWLRRQGENSNMTEERIELLEKAEFIWDVREYRWNLKFNELAEFYIMNGHHKIPSKTKHGESLARWTRRQRSEYQKMLDGKKSLMSDDRIKKLQSINFC